MISLAAIDDLTAQVPVPPECVQLAQREGFPTDVLSKLQLAKAKYRLYRLNQDDPLVWACRAAVAQLQAMQHQR